MRKLFMLAALAAAMMVNAEVIYQYTIPTPAPSTGVALTAEGGTYTAGGGTIETKEGKMAQKLDGNASATNTKYGLCKLNEELKAGDIITVNVLGGSNPSDGQGIKVSTNRDASTLIGTYKVTAKNTWEDASFTLAAGNPAVGQKEFYVSRNTSSVYISSVTVTRADATYPKLKSYVISGISAVIDQDAKTVTAELPYGTDKTKAIEEAQVTITGTATGWSYNGDKTAVVVTDETDNNTYTLNITVGEPSSEKNALNVYLSNGVRAFIKITENAETHEVSYAINGAYMAGEEVPTIASYEVSEFATAELKEGKLVVTAQDGSKAEYSINMKEITPLSTEKLNKEITFDTTAVADGGYVFSVYGWQAEKGVMWAKDVDEPSNMRIQTGKSRVYFFLPAAEKVVFTSGLQARGIKVTVNGVEDTTVKTTAAASSTFEITLNTDNTNLVGIEANGSKGDAGVTKMTVVNAPTAVENAEAEIKAVKVIENGQLFIIKNGVRYNAAGAAL